MDIFRDLFIFEMANNHQGSVEHGLDIIKEMGRIARKHNINAAVKLQYRNLDNFIHPDFIERQDVPHVSRFIETRLTANEFEILVDAIKDEGMVTMCTPFDEDSVELCMDHGLDIIKIASCSAIDWPLLTKIASTHKPVIISTGGKSLSDIDKIYNFFTHKKVKIAFLHCVAMYPAPYGNLQLDFIDRLKRRYPDIVIGYSGHDNPDDDIVPIIAVSKGARILERHIGIETDSIKLNKYSMNPEQTDRWVKAALIAREICGIKGNGKYISQDELDSLNSLARGVYVKRAVCKGEEIKAEDVFFAMPCQYKQMTSGQFYDGITASKDYEANLPLYEIKKLDSISILRSVVHDAKGMLYEANIAIGQDFEVELSHHYGMSHFRQIGAIIINVINREYCKKLIIVLPGQKHPTHVHKVKEETFQLLYGDLNVTLNNELIYMKPGDIHTVKRGDKHSFTSDNGAIFEEVSTTHVKDDSYYEDSKISKLDPIERKSILKKW